MSEARILAMAAGVHLLLAGCCAVALVLPAEPVLGVHPALKPLKFGLSIALLLGTMAVLVPRLELQEGTRALVAWSLVVTMVLEMLPIVGQALRGRTSHFNLATPLDAGLWRLMQGAIVVATSVLIGLAVVATVRPLRDTSALDTFAWRAGLWLSLLGAVSGFAMGGALRHSVGGEDGARGLPFLGWSRSFGDLRVSHFVSLHALQAVPLVALVVARLPWPAAQWVAVVVASLVMLLASLGTLLQAFAGRPVW